MLFAGRRVYTDYVAKCLYSRCECYWKGYECTILPFWRVTKKSEWFVIEAHSTITMQIVHISILYW